VNLSDLFARVREALPDDIDDRTVELVERTAAAAVILFQRGAAGEDIERDMQHVKAQAANLSAEYLENTLNKVRDYLFEVVGKLLAGLV